MNASITMAVEAALMSPVRHSVLIAVDAGVAGEQTVRNCREAAETIRAQGETVLLVVVPTDGGGHAP